MGRVFHRLGFFLPPVRFRRLASVVGGATLAFLLAMPNAAWAQFDFADALAVKIRTYPLKRVDGKLLLGPDGMPQPASVRGGLPVGLKELPALPVDENFPGGSILDALIYYQKRDPLEALGPVLAMLENGYLEMDIEKPCRIDAIKIQYDQQPTVEVPSFKEAGVAALMQVVSDGVMAADLLRARQRLRDRYNKGLSTDRKGDQDAMALFQALRLAIALRYNPGVASPALAGLSPKEAKELFKAEAAKGRPLEANLKIGPIHLAMRAKVDRRKKSPPPAGCPGAKAEKSLLFSAAPGGNGSYHPWGRPMLVSFPSRPPPSPAARYPTAPPLIHSPPGIVIAQNEELEALPTARRPSYLASLKPNIVNTEGQPVVDSFFDVFVQVDPGTTDTVVRRWKDEPDPSVGTIDTEFVQLQRASEASVQFNELFDPSISLRVGVLGRDWTRFDPTGDERDLFWDPRVNQGFSLNTGRYGLSRDTVQGLVDLDFLGISEEEWLGLSHATKRAIMGVGNIFDETTSYFEYFFGPLDGGLTTLPNAGYPRDWKPGVYSDGILGGRYGGIVTYGAYSWWWEYPVIEGKNELRLDPDFYKRWVWHSEPTPQVPPPTIDISDRVPATTEVESVVDLLTSPFTIYEQEREARLQRIGEKIKNGTATEDERWYYEYWLWHKMADEAVETATQKGKTGFEGVGVAWGWIVQDKEYFQKLVDFYGKEKAERIKNHIMYGGGIGTTPKEAYEAAIKKGATPEQAKADTGYDPDKPKSAGELDQEVIDTIRQFINESKKRAVEKTKAKPKKAEAETGTEPTGTRMLESAFFNNVVLSNGQQCVGCVPDPVFDAALTPNDPHFTAKGSWGQKYADQWALQRIGFTPLEDKASAWHITTGTERPMVVAVIDTGIDLTHPDLHIGNIWFNKKEVPGNGRDDDDNGYIDDLVGWNFVQNSNNPFDLVGHGTHVAGLIAARWNNGRGIAGINRGAKIMVLKALNEVGKAWGSNVARAMVYAVDNGAQIINLSAEHTGHTKFVERAFAYAEKKGVLVVVSAGNKGLDTKKVEPANQPGTLVVAATLPNDRRAKFANWGQEVDVAAPGVDVLSLRATRTDLIRKIAPDPKKVKAGEAVVASEYYRAGGTSFSAPLVSGLASLILAKNPKLTSEQVARMIRQSARDIEVPGWDQFTGYGLVDARGALTADPGWYLVAKIHSLQGARENGKPVVQVMATVEGSALAGYEIQLGKGKEPKEWRTVAKKPPRKVIGGVAARLKPADFGGPGTWTVRVIVRDKGGRTREARGTVTLR